MVDELETAFKTIFGVERYAYQTRTARSLLEGHNVLLRAPTGAGKTMAALFPWLYARQQGLSFADRLIYALPVRTLATALYASTRDVVQANGLEVSVTIQTGTSPEDSFFEGDIVFTTIDQILSAYIGVPVSLSPRMANLPAGALIGAYVVFDEFHLMEPGRALATALDLADRMKGYTRVLLMTATYGEEPTEVLANRAGAQMETVTVAELPEISSQRDKERWFFWHDEPITAQDIIERHRDRTIVVVNRVGRAQSLFRDLQREAKEKDLADKLLLLHSRFLPEDRAAIEADVLSRFGKTSQARGILIATQVIEVGLDISASVMHTEVAPASAVFQRAGRCARFEGERGDVHVYALPTSDKGRREYAPYLGDESPLVDATADEMRVLDGQVVGFAVEAQVIDRVLSIYDRTQIESVGRRSRQVAVENAMRSVEPASVRQLIRDVNDVTIIVHDDPKQLRLDHRPESFSVDRNVVEGMLRNLDLSDPTTCVCMPRFEDAEDSEGSRSVRWVRVQSAEDVRATFIIVIGSAHASYCRTTGLTLGEPGAYQARETLARHDPGFEPYSYQFEPYEEHIRRVVECHQHAAGHYRVARERLAAKLKLPEDEIEEMSVLVALLHDVGKLAVKWQDAMWLWQQEVIGQRRQGFIAHSTYNPSNPRHRVESRQRKYRKPPHAAEGAYASVGLLTEAVERLEVDADLRVKIVRALMSAIVRHHGARTKNLSEFHLTAKEESEVRRALKVRRLSAPLLSDPGPGECKEFQKEIADPAADREVYPLYLYVARRLRLADQGSLKEEGTA